MDLEQQAAVTAINKMLRSNYFNICTIDDICKMLDIIPEPRSYKILKTLHCTHYSEMESELRKEMPNLIKQCLSYGDVIQFELKKERAPFELVQQVGYEKKTWMQKLLS